MIGNNGNQYQDETVDDIVGVAQTKSRRIEHIVVAALSLVGTICIVLSVVLKPTSQGWRAWSSSLVMNLASGIVASLLTFLLIDLLLNRQRSRESVLKHEIERQRDVAESSMRRREALLAHARTGGVEEARGVIEEFRSLGWLRDGFLRGADLSGADLQGVDMDAADLRDTLFIGANLQRATFRRADVSRARFNSTDLRGARFDQAHTEGADFANSRTDASTILPEEP